MQAHTGWQLYYKHTKDCPWVGETATPHINDGVCADETDIQKHYFVWKLSPVIHVGWVMLYVQVDTSASFRAAYRTVVSRYTHFLRYTRRTQTLHEVSCKLGQFTNTWKVSQQQIAFYTAWEHAEYKFVMQPCQTIVVHTPWSKTEFCELVPSRGNVTKVLSSKHNIPLNLKSYDRNTTCRSCELLEWQK